MHFPSLLPLLAIPVRLGIGVLHILGTGRAALLEVRPLQEGSLCDRERWLSDLRAVARDRRISAVLVHLDALPQGWASCQDLRDALHEVRASGTGVYAYLVAPTTTSLWVASVADRIWIPPLTHVHFLQMVGSARYFGGLLDKLGVEVEVVSVGDYKSAGEPFSRTGPSPAAREAVVELVTELQEQVMSDLAEARSQDVDELRALTVQTMLTPEEGLAAGLVDHVGFIDELIDWTHTHHGKTLRKVGFGGWARRRRWLDRLATLGRREQVAVVYLEGAIVQHEGKDGSMEPEPTVEVLDALREDKGVAAVVLAINSPGGSAVGSELIAHAVERLAEAKPVVAAYANVAASGGVLLSAPATEVVARPMTITGSVGVIGGKLVLREVMRRVGVHTHELGAAGARDPLSPYHRFSEAERGHYLTLMTDIYQAFVDRVAKGRGLEVAEIEPHCRGRVWTGHAARERGLVDRLGDLRAACDRAIELAGISGSKTRVVHVEPGRRGYVQTIVRKQFRRGLGSMAHVLDDMGEETMWVRFLQHHAGRPLYLLPWRIEPGRRPWV
jgi:protease-4